VGDADAPLRGGGGDEQVGRLGAALIAVGESSLNRSGGGVVSGVSFDEFERLECRWL
jgi:hypothetical protein